MENFNKSLFNVNDRVKVISSCDSNGYTGKIIKHIPYPKCYNRRYVQVLFDNGGRKTFNESSLKLLQHNN